MPESATPGGLDRRLRLAAGPAAFALVLVLPLGVSHEAHRLAAIFAWAIAYWAGEVVPPGVTALLLGMD